MPILGQMLLVILANTLIQWLIPYSIISWSIATASSARQGVIKKATHLPLAYLDRQGTVTVSRVTTDLEQLSNGLLCF